MPTNTELPAELIAQLKTILEKRYKRPVSLQEAADTGRWLVGFYGKLADNKLGIRRPKEPGK